MFIRFKAGYRLLFIPMNLSPTIGPIVIGDHLQWSSAVISAFQTTIGTTLWECDFFINILRLLLL